MSKAKAFRLIKKDGSDRGFTTLEYCAGAAMVLVTVYAAYQSLGTNVSGLMGSVGSWATKRTTEINNLK